MQCGSCTASCPLATLSNFNIRRLVRYAQLSLYERGEVLARYPWLCTLCSKCQVLCKKGLEIPKLVLAIRRVAVASKQAPPTIYEVSEAIEKLDSPYRSLTRSKASWAAKLEAKASAGSKLLYWVGCTLSFRAVEVARASAEALSKLGLDFKLLMNEPCCGEPLIELGLVEEARRAAARAVRAIEKAEVERVVTSCSGCYYAFTKLYPEVLGLRLPSVEVLHLSQLLERSIKRPLKLREALALTYHDPCTLGRQLGVYEAPRSVLNSIEGVSLVELPMNRADVNCCGGGGGLWMLNYEAATKTAYRKLVREVLPLKVRGLVTCCPMCYMNFSLAAKRSKLPISIYDISSVVSMSELA
ncbi:MAG: (Fe-S)-binding protein [Candidatus Nezhaarchaeota archaeon]|nr:(Fe-S)-binding protein [Candidatus Nezhaarchaeota archaeon]